MWMTVCEYYNLSPDAVQPETIVCFKVVAWIGRGNWAAYRGPSDWTDERVRLEGDKIHRLAAEHLFPTFRNAGLIYRE